MKADKNFLLTALFRTILIMELVGQNTEPTDEEIRVFIADSLIEVKNDPEAQPYEIEALETWDVADVRRSIEEHRRAEKLVKEIFREDDNV